MVMNTFIEDGPKNPIKIQDNTFRDGHQSLLATRMRTEDMLPIAEKMDNVGFWAMEVWGGATFDTMHCFLEVGLFDRIKTLKKNNKKATISILLGGQGTVDYRNYEDDVAKLFVDKSSETVFNVFDVQKRIKINLSGKNTVDEPCTSFNPSKKRKCDGSLRKINYKNNLSQVRIIK